MVALKAAVHCLQCSPICDNFSAIWYDKIKTSALKLKSYQLEYQIVLMSIKALKILYGCVSLVNFFLQLNL